MSVQKHYLDRRFTWYDGAGYSSPVGRNGDDTPAPAIGTLRWCDLHHEQRTPH